MKKILFIAFVFSIIQQANAQLCFYPATTYSVGANTNTKNITTGDFNGDGFQDLAMAIVTPSLVSILLNDGAGHFPTAHTYTTNGQPYGICSADFNGDGKTDVAVVNNSSTFVGFSVMLGNGAGALGSAMGYSVGTNPAGIVTADFNNDGKKDIAITDFNAPPTAAIPVYLGNGAGSFTHHTTLSTGTGTVSARPGNIVCADVNSDGKLDFLVACEDVNDRVYIFPGDGAGGSTTPYAYTAGNFSLTQLGLAIGDFDGNGKIDIVTSNGADGNITVFLNNSAGSGSFTSNSYTSGNNSNAVACGDYDGDGDVDIAVANSSNNQIGILLNNGLGVFTPPATSSSFAVATSPIQMVSADFDGNGKPDIATANQGSDNASVLLNSLPGTITISGTMTVCAGNSTVLTAAGTDAYVWSANAASVTTNTASVSPTTNNTTYTVTGNNTGCTVTATGTVNVAVNALPVINIATTSIYICNGKPITLTATGAITYTWTNGIMNGVAFTPTAVATYTVAATDANSCQNTATINIGQSVPQVPQICMVTTDSATFYNYNIIYWDNTQYTNVDSFIVYRYEALANAYKKIGMVGGDSSRMMDTARHVQGVNDGDPNFTSYKYTLAIKDSCGNVGQQSPYHETVFLQDQHNGNFNINPYTIGSGQASPVNGYVLYKDPTGTGNHFAYLTTITGTSGTDPGYVVGDGANYRTDILGFNCTANGRMANPNGNTFAVRQRSHSNTSRISTTGVGKVGGNNRLNIYPNPTSSKFIIETNVTAKQTVQLFDVNGKLVLTETIYGTSTIDGSALANGVYNLTISGSEGFVNKRLVIVK